MLQVDTITCFTFYQRYWWTILQVLPTDSTILQVDTMIGKNCNRSKTEIPVTKDTDYSVTFPVYANF